MSGDLVSLSTVLSSLVLLGLLIPISIVDLRQFRIPNALSFLLTAVGLLHAVSMAEAVVPRLAGAAGGYLFMALWGEVYFRLRGREGLGLGDAKLFAGAGAWLGWQDLPLVLLIAATAGLGYALVARIGQDDKVPFGPFIALGTFGVWCLRRFLGA